MNSSNTSDQYKPASSRLQSVPQSQQARPARMPKAQALALAQKFKRGIVVASILCFGTVGGLVINQTTVTAAQQSTSSTTSTNQSTTNQSSSKNFFQQGTGSNFGSSNSTTQSPVSGSSVS